AREKLARDPDSAALFLPEGQPLVAGYRLVQPNLARTLRRLAEGGPAVFYDGDLGIDFIDEIRAKGGVVSRADLAGYRAVWRTPVRFDYGPDTLYSMPPPSAGGISLAQILGMFARFKPDDLEQNSARYIHLLAEIEKRVYADRNTYLGDPEQVPLRWTKLLEPAYLRRRVAEIDGQKATPSVQVQGGYGDLDTGGLRLREAAETTSYLVLDDAGHCVSVTYTLNGSFGSGILLPKTGLLLNNEMDDFAAKPGTPNLYGLVQGPANAVAPGKRMLSSITPTIVLRAGRLRMALGSPGGSRIITTVLQMYLNATLFGMDAPAAVAAPRFHHQWLPDEINLEPVLFADEALTKKLLGTGQQVSERDRMGDGVMILRTGKGTFSASADPRGCGTARVE
ncbi:MAG: gamma-glutamyltransferase, partial [Acidobacteria bacterium]|nr:gamma-glutamyltransferase [Acidobacteriota bacterium]